MAGRIRDFDWAATPLGPIETWPASLRTSVGVILGAPLPMWIGWGPDFIQIYNDPFAVLLADARNPAVLGQPVVESWSTVWALFGADLENVHRTGAAVFYTDRPITYERGGIVRQFYFSYSCSPIPELDGGIGGVLCVTADTTSLVERGRMETALRESEARSSTLLQGIAQAYWEADPEGQIVTDSVSWRSYTGQSVEQWVGRGWTEAVHPEDRPEAERQWRQAIAERRLVEAEFRLRAADGSYRWSQVRAAPLWSPDGTLQKWVGMNIDIDHRKRAEEELRRNQERQRLLTDSVPALIGYHDRETRYVWLNAEYERFFGVPREEILGKTMREWIGEEAWERHRPHVEAALAGERVRFEDYGSRKQGPDATGWTEENYIPNRDEHDEIRGFYVLSLDITERKRTELALRESEERFRQFGEASSDVLWIRNARSLRFEYVSPAFEAHYGAPRETVLHDCPFKHWAQMIVPDDRVKAFAALKKVRSGQLNTEEFRIRPPADGQIRWVQDTSFPLLDENGKVHRIAGITKDVTRARQWAEQMQVMVAELQHRTRNLIGVVRSIAAQFLATSGSLEEFRVRFHDRLAALSRVQGLLSRADLEPITIGTLVRNELAALGAEEQTEVGGPDVRLRSSIVQTLALAIHELATNARKYGALSGKGGHLSVHWDTRREADGRRWLAVDWQEDEIRTGDDAAPPAGGYGRKLIEEALPYAMNAKTNFELGGGRLRCSIELPLDR